MSKEIETVDEHCSRADCIYRKSFGKGFCCMYASIEHQTRGCSISDCTRYKPGIYKHPRMNVTTEIYWEYEELGIYRTEDFDI